MHSQFCPWPILSLTLAGGAMAQGFERAPTRLATGEEVIIDGVLDEPIWGRATELGRLMQVEPLDGLPATRETEVRLAYDQDALYIGMKCFDDPALVRDRLMTRDADLDPDDRVELWVDGYGTARFGFWFQIGAGGSKGDALLADGGSRFNKRWDGIWYGDSRVTADGWHAEIRLPFKTLGFDPEAAAWGFNLRRLRKANGEEMRWASPDNAYRFFNLARGGRLVGMTGLHQGVGIDVVPYVKAAASRDRRIDDHTTRTGDFGLDVSYHLTPSLDLQLTHNTDFAETEVDDRQVNLGRFPLFFPEKRDFFLQDAGLFEFGPQGSATPLPFFSRRIGRDQNGQPVPVIAGAKLTGHVDTWNIGALGTLIDATANDPEKGLGAARISHNVGEESSVGMIATAGRPIGPGDAATYGADFRLRDSDLFGEGRSGQLAGYWLATQSEGTGGEGDAWGARAEYGSDTWDHDLTVSAIAPGFSPELGFVRRTGIRRYDWNTQWSWRIDGDLIRRVNANLSPTLTTTIGNTTDSWEVDLTWLDVEFASEDQIEAKVTRSFERVPAFDLTDSVTVSAGDYTMTRHEFTFEASDKRVVSGQAELEVGDFFSGNLTRWKVEPAILPSRHFRLAGGYEEFRVRLDEGRFTTRITDARLDLDLSRELSWRNLVQYDSESKDLTWQSRLHWIVEPGQDLYLLAVYGWNRMDHDAPLIPTSQDLTLKFSHTLRF